MFLLKRISCLSIILVFTSSFLFISCNGIGSSESEISFNRDIRPILNDKCLGCHGGVKANGGLSLLFEEDAFGKTQSGKPAIVRGNHKKSEFFKRLVHEDPDVRMPLESDPLSAEEIELVKKWIDQGAKWEKHWAYIPPKSDIPIPTIEKDNWSSNPVDKFILQKVKENGLIPSPEASKEVLLRRVYLDLIGLPPASEEIDNFMSDTSKNAYEKVVDQLLSSSHFGERWASMWLDLARYADSKGYEKDTNREIWKYRDWVINAFNSDMPFNQFTIEQLAGDLLEAPTEEQLIATAFHRNTLANDEGGTDNEEFRVASVVERIATTYEVWQGTTMTCVQCHSHPYDPFKQEEFYQSMAFFNNSVDNDSYFEQPKLFTYSPINKKKVEELIQYINSQLLDEHKPVPTPRYLHNKKEALLSHLGYKSVEAETFDESSPFIEFDGTLNFLWQVQDSSWVRYDQVNLDEINKIGFTASSDMNYAGEISVRLDSLKGDEIGRVRITNTEKSRLKRHGQNLKEFIASIDPVRGVHDLYLQFYKGESYKGHLFYVDKLFYYEREPKMNSYDTNFKQKLEELARVPTTTTPIIQELKGEKARKTYLFERGSWLSLGKEVERGIPNIYGISESDEPKDRLEFSQWLVSEKNPITARVVVNRFWEHLFGFGLVETMEEFGSQGDAPTHPELLDWMANQFVNKYNWSMKSMIKEMVLSSTYRQSSVISEKKLAVDPKNKWLSRMSRTRLSAEQIRDQILLVSGLLNKKIGGPSVISDDVEISGGWRRLPSYAIKGDSAKYRRSLYTFWKRVNPPMNLISFDSPDRSVCASRRIRTNTPLQALNLLNDQTIFEASQALAEQMNSKEDGIKFAYFKLMGKEISSEKLRLLEQLYKEAYQSYLRNGKSKEFPEVALKSQGKDKFKLAAFTIVANALLNLDEFVVKG